MSTSKTVNVTTGKVLNYTVSKTGYKTVHGSKLITGNMLGADAITVNMVPSEATTGTYVFGDRIGGVASFYMYFDSINPDTQVAQKYAVFVLDAAYRWHGAWNGGVSDWVTMATDSNTALNSTESATYRCGKILDHVTPTSGSYQPIYYAMNPNGQSLIITVGGVNYQAVVPNAKELLTMWQYRTQLDAIDPTLAAGTGTLSLTNWYGIDGNYGVWTCMSYNSERGWNINKYGNVGEYIAYYDYRFDLGSFPVFEIPVN